MSITMGYNKPAFRLKQHDRLKLNIKPNVEFVYILSNHRLKNPGFEKKLLFTKFTRTKVTQCDANIYAQKRQSACTFLNRRMIGEAL